MTPLHFASGIQPPASMTDTTERLRSALADRYRIERQLGEGGMATVYLAHDLKHDRKVALKVLKPELAAVLGAERFVQEIKTTASLQHPHILPLFDSGEADGFLYYVMPYIEGETLRQKLDRETQLAVTEAVQIATEVADALDYAHRAGVIHRDIKPENILLHDGRPVVADFGIALAVSAAAGGRMTETGLSLGTPHYMSPEQATAEKDITARSDVYSLGSVLYEMVTGSPPHVGASAQQIIMKIVTEEAAPVTSVRRSVPPHVAAAIRTSLAKLPADRFASAADFRAALADLSYGMGLVTGGGVNASRRTPREHLGWGLAAALALALVWSLAGDGEPAPAPATRFAFSMGTDASASLEIEISHDGRRVVQPRGLRGRLMMRDLASLEATTIAGTSGERPRFSPDDRWIAYTWGGDLRKVPVGGGTPTVLTDRCRNADWIDADGLVCVTDDWGLGRVPSGGGVVEELTAPDTASGEIGHWTPTALPGGRAVLFTSYRRPMSRIEAYEFGSGRRTILVENAVMARYARSGHLLYVRDNALFAIRFNAKSLRTRGTAVPVLEDVGSRPSDAVAAFAISESGTLVALRQSQWDVPKRLVWVDRRGGERVAMTSAGNYFGPRLSPDGSKVVLTVTGDGRDLWIYDLRRAALTQLTRSPMSAFGAVWTPDGRGVAYTNETPAYDIYRLAIDGSAPPAPVVANTRDKYPTATSPDGAAVAYRERWAGRSRTLVVPLDGSAPPVVVGDTALDTYDATFSPDGRWIAHGEGSWSSGNIFVRRVDGSGGRLQISAGEGLAADPRWTKNGREIVFRRGDAVVAVDVDLERGHVGAETKLFEGPYPWDRGYDVTPDGTRFLMVKQEDRPDALPTLVIMNFFEELKAKVGG
ncbi:MAG TPA: protein kinase [Gemmatimonadales bacterium]